MILLSRLPGGYQVKITRGLVRFLFSFVLLGASCAAILCAQGQPESAPKKAIAPAKASVPANISAAPVLRRVSGGGEIESVRRELFRLLRMSPRLTSILGYDPSLLGYADYVSNNNPELAAFLEKHPEIVRNPEFYLFANLPRDRNGSIPYLFRQSVWPEMSRDVAANSGNDEVAMIFVFLIISGAVIWLLRLFMQNRRWNRIFRVQTETHAKLLERFGGSGELLTYLETETGRKLMAAAPITSIDFPSRPSFLSPITRILAPLQFGIVSAMAGIGILFIKSYFRDSGELLLAGTLALVLGIGLVLAAGLSWIIARRLGLLEDLKREPADAPVE